MTSKASREAARMAAGSDEHGDMREKHGCRCPPALFELRRTRRSSGLHASLARACYFRLAEPMVGCHASTFRLGAAAITLILSFFGFLASRLPFCWPFATWVSLGFENSADRMQRRRPDQKNSSGRRRGASRSYLVLSAAIISSVQVR